MMITGHIKQLMNASKNLSFIFVKYDIKTDEALHNEYLTNKNIQDLSFHPMNNLLIVNSLVNKDKYIGGPISFTSICLVMLLILLLISGLWLVKVKMYVDVYNTEGIFTLTKMICLYFPLWWWYRCSFFKQDCLKILAK